jgi:lipopolysaccharide transport system ATP-binding protein
MEQIVEFADIGPFLDTPIKRYSSGMRMRLGFSVAAHLNTEVLFVDEVLAVGDVAFQKKCLGAMRNLAEGGRTVIFVSHNLAAVENLCTRSLWIAAGKLRMDGGTRDVISAYLDSFGAADARGVDLTDVRERKGKGDIRFTRMEVLSREGNPVSAVHSGDSFSIRLNYECRRDVPNPHFGVRFFSNLGTLLADVNTWSTGFEMPMAARGSGCIQMEIEQFNFQPGSYYVGVWAHSMFEAQDDLDNAATLAVESSDFYGTGRGVESRFGLLLLPCRWSIPERLAESNGSEALVRS